MTDKEARLLAKIAKLAARREYHVWRLGDVDRQINEATRLLADERGVCFLRPEVVLIEAKAGVPK